RRYGGSLSSGQGGYGIIAVSEFTEMPSCMGVTTWKTWPRCVPVGTTWRTPPRQWSCRLFKSSASCRWANRSGCFGLGGRLFRERNCLLWRSSRSCPSNKGGDGHQLSKDDRIAGEYGRWQKEQSFLNIRR